MASSGLQVEYPYWKAYTPSLYGENIEVLDKQIEHLISCMAFESINAIIDKDFQRYIALKFCPDDMGNAVLKYDHLKNQMKYFVVYGHNYYIDLSSDSYIDHDNCTISSTKIMEIYSNALQRFVKGEYITHQTEHCLCFDNIDIELPPLSDCPQVVSSYMTIPHYPKTSEEIRNGDNHGALNERLRTVIESMLDECLINANNSDTNEYKIISFQSWDLPNNLCINYDNDTKYCTALKVFGYNYSINNHIYGFGTNHYRQSTPIKSIKHIIKWYIKDSPYYNSKYNYTWNGDCLTVVKSSWCRDDGRLIRSN